MTGGLPFDPDAASLARAETWNLVCRFGEPHVSFHPEGFPEGYPALALRSLRVRVGSGEGVVAHLAKVIWSKEAARRPNDVRVHPSPLLTSGDPGTRVA